MVKHLIWDSIGAGVTSAPSSPLLPPYLDGMGHVAPPLIIVLLDLFNPDCRDRCSGSYHKEEDESGARWQAELLARREPDPPSLLHPMEWLELVV